MILVTGGAGFIGANFVLDWLADGGEPVINLDKLTYAGNLLSLASLAGDARHEFVRGDIGDTAVVGALLARHRPRAIVNFAAETHVDRSIRGPAAFIDTNVVGTLAFLECVREWWAGLPDGERTAFRFLHVSTDEVYGSLGRNDPPFCETTPYAVRITSVTAWGWEIMTTCEASISVIVAPVRSVMKRRASVPTALSPVGITAQVGSTFQAGFVVGSANASSAIGRWTPGTRPPRSPGATGSPG